MPFLARRAVHVVWTVLALALPWGPGTAQTRTRAPGGAQRETVVFKLDHAVGEPNRAVYVSGSLPELGADDVREAVELTTADGLTWRVPVSLPADRDYSYRFVERSSRNDDLADEGNALPLSGPFRARTRSSAGGPGTKSLQVHTTLSAPRLFWRQDQGEFEVDELEALGPGRTAGEGWFGLRDFATGGRALEFFLQDPGGGPREPEQGTHRTALDELFLQDGELFGYVPAAQVDPPRRDYDPGAPPTIDSVVLGRTRSYRVMLPRGYDQQLWRRYPVLYVYDGQVVWDAGASSWDRNGNRMARLVREGAVGEMIQVAVDYLGSDPCSITRNRGRDCLSPEDTITLPLGCGDLTGEADRFLLFLTQELKPRIDATYRTWPGRDTTFATGYSFGGVFALYAGWEHSATFGAVAAQSGSFWVPNFPARVRAEARRDVRLYLDYGDLEGGSITNTNALLRHELLARPAGDGFVLAGDLGFTIGFGQNHSHRSGGQRMPVLLEFLWPAPRAGDRVPWPADPVPRPR